MTDQDGIRAFLDDYPHQRERWRRFQEWEDRQLVQRSLDWNQAVEWMASAWETANRYDPDWNSATRAREHWQHLVEMRARLARGFSKS